jgi:hypothetical protein
MHSERPTRNDPRLLYHVPNADVLPPQRQRDLLPRAGADQGAVEPAQDLGGLSSGTRECQVELGDFVPADAARVMDGVGDGVEPVVECCRTADLG